MHRLAFISLSLLTLVGLASRDAGQLSWSQAGGRNSGVSGAFDGVWLWTLPDTPNGLRPSQSWHATASSPGGDIYVAGMDHRTNAALYRLDWRKGELRLVGDARSASEAVGNWKPGETAQKFHTRPLWHRGKIYVATMNRSTLDDGYLGERGFHWYAYDPIEDKFSDLSVSEPQGTAVEHGNVVTLASDPVRNIIYAAGVPTGEIFRYDVSQRRTIRLGRPDAYDQRYVYTGRVMWVDSRGRLYFTASNSNSPSAFKHVYYYDPELGFGERKDWQLEAVQALETGQCIPERRECIFADDKGHIYRFNDDGPSWSYAGQIETNQRGYVWVFDVSADSDRVYAGTSPTSHDDPSLLVEFDLRTAKTEILCTVAELDPALRGLNIHTGYNAWDPENRFYFASFNGQPDQPVILTRVDVRRLKTALKRAR
jgi:sugar lactone lactonase YvrE